MQVLKIARSDGVLSLSGEIDLSVAEDVRAALVDASDAGIRVIDVSEVTFIDSMGVRTLLMAARSLNGSGPLVLRDPSDSVRRVLDIMMPNGVPELEVEASA